MILRRHRTVAYYLDRIEIEIRERVIRRERELREEREQRLWEHSTVEALQAVTEFVPDEEVESIASSIREKWVIKGDIHGREELLEKEIRESVIKREIEIGREKERIQREQSQLEALKEITDFVTSEEIEQIASEVREKYRAKIEAIEKKQGVNRQERTLSGVALKEFMNNRKKLRIGNTIVVILLFIFSISFWSRPEEFFTYLYWILPFILIIIVGFIKQQNLWHLLVFYPLWALFYLVVGLTFIKPAIMDSKSWVNHKEAERLIDPISKGDMGTLLAMVENGAKINVNRSGNFTPLMAAVREGDLSMVRILVEHGANLNPAIRNGRKTALVMAIEKGYPHIVRYLVEQGAWINLPDAEGRTALFYAVTPVISPETKNSNYKSGDPGDPDPGLIDFLITEGARTDWLDDEDRDILSHAIYYKKVDAVRLLRERGLEFKRIKKKNMIPGITNDMIYSAMSCPGDQQLAWFLAVEGDYRNPKELDIAASVACSCGLEEIFSVLADLGAGTECN